jgi:hypothetical protein
MSSQQLMAALMSPYRFEGKVIRVGVALERLGIAPRLKAGGPLCYHPFPASNDAFDQFRGCSR